MKKVYRFTHVEFIFVLILISILPWLLHPAISSKQSEKSIRTTCSNHLKQIGLALSMYAQENKGEYPPYDGAKGLEMLRAGGYLENIYMYTCPSTKDWDKAYKNNEIREEYCSFEYRAGLNKASSGDRAVAWDKSNNHANYGNVLFADGHIEDFAGAKWMENIKWNR